MISYSAKRITMLLINENIIDKKEKDIYQYGAELLISTGINCFLIQIISLINGNMMGGIFYIIVLATVRTQTGGYHAKNYLSCCCMGSSVYIVILIMIRLKNYYSLYGKILYLLPMVIIAISYHTSKLNKIKNGTPNQKIIMHATKRSILWAGIATGIYMIYNENNITDIIFFTLVAILFFIILDERRIHRNERKNVRKCEEVT